MALTSRPLLILSAVAATAITQYRGVGFNDSQATVAGQKIKGIARRGAAIGADVDLVSKGTAVVEAGAAIAVGASVVMDASGRVVTASALTAAVGTLAVAAGATAVTSAVANGAGSVTGAPALSGSDLPQFTVGIALTAATAAGDFVEVLLA
jgi:hypothetical protein